MTRVAYLQLRAAEFAALNCSSFLNFFLYFKLDFSFERARVASTPSYLHVQKISESCSSWRHKQGPGLQERLPCLPTAGLLRPPRFLFFKKWGPDAWLTFIPASPEGIRHQTLLRCSRAIRNNVEKLKWSACEGPARTHSPAFVSGLRDLHGTEEVGLLFLQCFFHLSRMAHVSGIT